MLTRHWTAVNATPMIAGRCVAVPAVAPLSLEISVQRQPQRDHRQRRQARILRAEPVWRYLTAPNASRKDSVSVC